MPKGAFTVEQSAEDPLTLDINLRAADAEVDDAQQELVDIIIRTNSTLRQIVDAKNEYRKMAVDLNTQLAGIAQVGLVGDWANPRLATRAILPLQAEATNLIGGRLRRHQWTLLAAFTLVPAILLAGLQWLDDFVLHSPMLQTYPILLAGCLVATWLSFGIRTGDFQFAMLPELTSARTEPAMRAIFAGALCLVSAVFLVSGALELSIVGVDVSGTLQQDWAVAFSVGALCGLSERTLPAALVRRAEALLGGADSPP